MVPALKGLQKCPATIKRLELLRNVAVYSLNMEANQSRCRGGGVKRNFGNEECSRESRLDRDPNQTSAAVSIPKRDSHMLASSDRNHDLVALAMRPHGRKFDLPSGL
ncbi:hypothetical protein K443DRAFT_635535, partial [Laccaria amethystina LaAM-08-1]